MSSIRWKTSAETGDNVSSGLFGTDNTAVSKIRVKTLEKALDFFVKIFNVFWFKIFETLSPMLHTNIAVLLVTIVVILFTYKQNCNDCQWKNQIPYRWMNSWIFNWITCIFSFFFRKHFGSGFCLNWVFSCFHVYSCSYEHVHYILTILLNGFKGG